MTSISAPGGITVTEHGSIFADGRQGVDTFRWISIRRGLKMEIETGMKMTRRSTLAYLQEAGITTARNKRKAYADLDRQMVEAGFDSLPLKD